MSPKTKFYATEPATVEHIHNYRQHPIPDTPTQALMEAAPYDEPEESSLEKQVRLEDIRDVLEDRSVLTERERWVIEGLFWRGRSLEQIGRELGLVKSSIWRIRESAFNAIREHMDNGGTTE